MEKDTLGIIYTFIILVIITIIIIIALYSDYAVTRKNNIKNQEEISNSISQTTSNTNTNVIDTLCDPNSLDILRTSEHLITCGDCSNLSVGGICNFTCDDDTLMFLGQGNVTCLQTGFSNINSLDPPRCIIRPPTCPLIIQDTTFGIQAGSICIGAGDGDICQLFCNPGYIPNPLTQIDGTLLCENGIWSGNFSCIPTTCHNN